MTIRANFPHRAIVPLLTILLTGCRAASAATSYVLLGWNNLGMHCMDSDYSVFTILPPYNTVNAQLVAVENNRARLVTDFTPYSVTYEPMADANGSINSTSRGKSNFWDYSGAIFGVTPAEDAGLPVPGPTAWEMPGTNHTPRAMAAEAVFNWLAAYGVPITPYDDEGKPNQYPMMRLRAKMGAATVATADVVLPVSDEMDCKLCHLSGSGDAARPAAGWVNDAFPGRDYRLNILRLHDESQAGNPLYAEALAARGFPPEGLETSVVRDGKPILCAACHLSEALPNTGYGDIPPLTRAMHSRHATVIDPRNNLALDATGNRVSCYVCHPGSSTRCLRGAMGKAVAADGSRAMQCQSCHGSMAEVGSSTRTGWLEEPNCQACHTGDAVANSGKIRYTDVFDAPGHMRAPANTRFATNPDTPAAGVSLYRFSKGHGGLQCSACHGSTHAIYPTSHPSDNVLAVSVQGHAGTISECTSCHGTQTLAYGGGPHGMHVTNNSWAQNHATAARSAGINSCRACHGLTERGTELSRVFKDRTISTKFGTRNFKQGQQIGCYECHDGSNKSDPSTRGFPTATGGAFATVAGRPVTFTLTASSANVRILTQPSGGTVALTGKTAIYTPETGFHGTDTFTFVGNNGYTESPPATVTLTVTEVFTLGDGVPDWWRALHFGGDGTTAANQGGAGEDPDGDGETNRAEYLCGTDPLDERFALRMLPPVAGEGGVEVPFASEPGVRYVLESREMTPGAPWSPVVSNIWGRIDSSVVEDAGAPGAPGRHYRVRVQP
jgi:hypothetical protein